VVGMSEMEKLQKELKYIEMKKHKE
jgi:hypothetical protein